MNNRKTNHPQESKRAVEAQHKWRAEYRAKRFVQRFGLSAFADRTRPLENQLDALLRKLADQA